MDLPEQCRTRYGTHKLAYVTWDDGELACYAMREKSETLFAYRAPCGAYHIGHAKLAPPDPPARRSTT